MRTLRISLLGDFRLMYDDAAITSVNTPRLQALFAYLLLHRQAPQSRQQIAFQFWPDSSEKQAHTNLRKLLFQLRNALPDSDTFFTQDHLTVQWRPDAPYTLDVAELQTTLARCLTADGKPSVQAPHDALLEATNLYQGALLPSCFDEWLLPLRQQLQHDVIRVIEQLIHLAEHQREYQAGIRYAQRLLGLDPLHENTYLRLMQLHALAGDRVAALHDYHTCATLLQQELGVEPDKALRAFYEQLRKQTSQPSQQPATVMRLETPFIGRQPEWKTLLTAWRCAQRGQTHFISVAGEAGMGKSRLAEELMTWVCAQGGGVAHSRCYEAEGGLVYAPIVEWLRSPRLQPLLVKLDKPWLSEIARLLPELLTTHPGLPQPGPLTQAWERQRLFEALACAILLDKGPLLLVLDDLQWCDGETLAWLRYLLRYAPQARLLLLGAWRSEAVDHRHPLHILLQDLQRANQITSLELPPLSVAETIDLAQQMTTRILTPDDTQQLVRATEGHPLFVVEMLRAVEDGGLVTGDQKAAIGDWRSQALPAKVQNVIQARLARLSTAARDLVELAATTGRQFSLAVLQEASTTVEDTLVQALDELWQRRIIREQGVAAYDFAHDKIREVAYQSLSQARRRLLHRRVATALERVSAAKLDESSAELAAHYEQAQLNDKAAHYWQRAGQWEAARYAQRTAIHYLSRALDLVPLTDVQQRAALLLARVKLYDHQGMRAEQKSDLAILQAIAEALGDGTELAIRRRAEIALCLADFGRGVADHTLQRTAAQAATQLAEQCSALDLAAHAYLLWGEADGWEFDTLGQARPRWEQALTLAQATGLHHIAGQALTQLSLHGLYTGHLVHEIEALAHQSLAAYRQLGNPAGEIGALGMLSYIFYTQREGNYAVGIRYCEQALEIAPGSGGWDAERLIVGNLGNLWQFEGEYTRAKHYLERQFQICVQAQHRNFIACSSLELGWLALMQGDYTLAQSQLTEALRIYQETGNQQQYRVKVLGLLALLHHAQDDHTQASRYGEAAVNFARKLHDPRVEGDALTRWARVLVSQGKLIEAAELFQQALICFRRVEQWNHATMPQAGLAELALRTGNPEQARLWLEPILTHLQTQQLDRTDEELYVYMTCYGVLCALQDPRAAGLLTHAYEQLQVRAASLTTEHERVLFWSAPPHALVLTETRKGR